MIKTKQEKAFEVFASVVMICVMVIVIFPFILLFISSITDEDTLLINGYSIFPEKLSFGAYKYIWNLRNRYWNSGPCGYRRYGRVSLVIAEYARQILFQLCDPFHNAV